nr:MAG TPA: hypothetical protein [Caudoviricetes sp.]
MKKLLNIYLYYITAHYDFLVVAINFILTLIDFIQFFS